MITILERTERYLAKCPPSISGQGGHNAAFHAAAVLVHGFALSAADAMSLLQQWNLSCQPPWSERELRHKIQSAGSVTHTNARGHLLGPDECPHPRTVAPSAFRRTLLDPKGTAEGFLKGFRCTEPELGEASTIRIDGEARYDGAVIVGALYQAREQINFVTDFDTAANRDGQIKAKPKGRGVTLERDALVARFEHEGTDSSEAGAWLRMNPVDGHGIADKNVTAFRFALLESDTLPPELQFPCSSGCRCRWRRF